MSVDKEQLIDALAQLSESEAQQVISAARQTDRATKKQVAADALRRFTGGTNITMRSE
ncbi:hypothetical protein [Mycobacterium sp. E787]|uniref:hypothetical protein n=1 Tax=Mycobacterium sp. E787 TaxID=1834150 RepID=UPI000B1E5962|nr:hypothetical protein [Mycobacterium sp. E787]